MQGEEGGPAVDGAEVTTLGRASTVLTDGELARVMVQWTRDRTMVTGAKLPTEREWMDLTGQSRTVVRRALARLEAAGRVERHVGRGTFLSDVADRRPGPATSTSPAEIMAVRLLVEPAAMGMVVVQARQQDFTEIERCLEGGDTNREYELFEQWDTAFHRALAVATQNQLLVSMMDLLHEARDQRLWGQMKKRSFTHERSDEYMRDHRDIAQAVYERDADAAEEAMRRHLIRVRGHVLGY